MKSHTWYLFVPTKIGETGKNGRIICPEWRCKPCGAVMRANYQQVPVALRWGVRKKEMTKLKILEDCDEEIVRQSIES